MRVCHITTFWPSHSGITHYVDALIAGMRATRQEKHYVVADEHSESADNDAYCCIPCWSIRRDYVDDIVRNVISVKADVVILQYTDDLFGQDNRIVRLLRKLEEVKIPTVVNLHSVYPPGWRTGYRPGKNAGSLDRAMSWHARWLTVHSKRMNRDLIDRGIDPEKVAIIPHGSKVQDPDDRAESRKKLGVPLNARMVLFFGFVWLGKGLDFLLDVFAKVSKEVSDTFLYIGGYTRKKAFYTRLYMGYLQARVRRLGIKENTRFWGDYVPDDLAKSMYSAADLVALPYKQDYSSVSGVVHQAAGLGTLMVCSRISKFDEVGESISDELLVEMKDKQGWVSTISRLLTDQVLADELRANVKKFAAETSWEEVGRIHLKLYDSLVK